MRWVSRAGRGSRRDLVHDKGSQPEKQHSPRFHKAQLTGELPSGIMFGAYILGPGVGAIWVGLEGHDLFSWDFGT